MTIMNSMAMVIGYGVLIATGGAAVFFVLSECVFAIRKRLR